MIKEHEILIITKNTKIVGAIKILLFGR